MTADNIFTSLPLAQDLLEDGLTHVGTIRSNKPDIPEAMKANNQRDVQSSLFGFKDQVTIVSYVPNHKKAVIVLSTMHHDASTEGDAQKPEIILHYNQTKSGVDTLDHLATMFTARRKVNRWPVVLFGNIIDVGAIAAFVIWMGNYAEWKASEGRRRRRLFLSELACQLVTPQVHRRANNVTLHAPVKLSMKLFGVEPAQVVQQGQDPPREGKRRRCNFCPREKDKKVRLECAQCKRAVCSDHSKQQVVCNECA